MKTSFYLFLFFWGISMCYPQQYIDDFIKISDIAVTSIPYQRDFTSPKCIDDNIVYILPKNINNQLKKNSLERMLYCYNFNTRKFDSLIFKLPSEDIINEKSIIRSISVENDILVVLYSNFLILYRISNNKILKHSKCINTGCHFDKLKCFDDKIVVVRCSNADLSCISSSKTIIGILDLKADVDTIYYFNIKDPKGLIFKYFQPPFAIDYNTNVIAVSDISSYRINLYNYNGELISSILRNPSSWKQLSDEKLVFFDSLNQKFPYHPKIIIDSLRDYFYNKISTIENISFLNDTTLLTSWLPKKNYENGFLKNKAIKYFDIWIKKENEWTLYQKDLINSNPDISENIDSVKILSYRRPWHAVDQSSIFNITGLYPFYLSGFDSFSEYLKKRDEFHLNNEIQITFLRYKYHD